MQSEGCALSSCRIKEGIKQVWEFIVGSLPEEWKGVAGRDGGGGYWAGGKGVQRGKGRSQRLILTNGK